MRGLSRLAGVLLVLLWSTAPAFGASSVTAPPGNSAGNEYVETLPGPAGNKVLAPATSVLLPASTAKSLAGRGAPGLLVLSLGPRSPALALASHTAPPSGLPPATTGTRPESTGTAFTQLLIGTGPGGMGWALPLILVLITLTAVGYAVRRARSGSAGPS